MSATPAAPAIRTDVMYLISADAALAARSMNLSVLPGFGVNDALIQHDALRAMTGAGWTFRGTQNTQYDGVVAIILSSPQENAAAVPVVAPPPQPVLPPFTHDEYFTRLEEIGNPCDREGCTSSACAERTRRRKDLEEQGRIRGILPPPAVIYSWKASDVERKKMLEKNAAVIERVLSPVVKQQIIVHHLNFYTDDYNTPPKAGCFHVFISHPTPTLSDLGDACRATFPTTCWGVSTEQAVKQHMKNIVPWFDGLPIITPEGDEIGAVSKNKDRLYIYFPSVYTASDSELAINEKIYETAVSILNEPEKHKRVVTRESYQKFCAGRIEKEAQAIESRKNLVVESIKEHQRELTALISESASIVRQAQLARTAVGQSTDRFAVEFDALSTRFPDVDNILVFGKVVMVDVKTQYVIDPRTKKEHELGRFRIVMNFLNSTIRMYNLDRTVNAYKSGFHAPHVFADGHGCLGTIENIMPQLIARMDVPTILTTILAYLSSVNTDDPAGRYVERWPLRGGPKTEWEGPPSYKIS